MNHPYKRRVPGRHTARSARARGLFHHLAVYDLKYFRYESTKCAAFLFMGASSVFVVEKIVALNELNAPYVIEQARKQQQ